MGLAAVTVLEGRKKKNKQAMRVPVPQPMTLVPSSKDLLCQPLQGAEPFLQVFLPYSLLLSESLIECKPNVWQTLFLQ